MKIINTKEEVLAAIMQNGYALQFASKRLKNDKEVVFAATQQNGRAWYYLGDELLTTLNSINPKYPDIALEILIHQEFIEGLNIEPPKNKKGLSI